MPVQVTADLELRPPQAGDGPALHRLVAQCPPLDANSLYCNLLHCTHFSPTSVAAVVGTELLGFISGYLVPDLPSPTLFVWQVAVAPNGRRRGLALAMLHALLERFACREVRFLHTSVTPENSASRALFETLARELDAPLRESLWFSRERDFDGAHADELLLEIGPIPRRAAPTSNH